MRYGIAAAVAAALLAVPSQAFASKWEFDPVHTTAMFTVKHLMVSDVTGRFKTVSGVVDLDEKSTEKSTVELEIDAASIDTNNEKRDGHLKSADFFEVDKHPKITFKSKKIAKAGKDKYKVTGDLTMRGVTKEVAVEVMVSGEMKGPDGAMKRGVSATAKINRTDWGLKWNMALEAGGGVIVGEQVQIKVDIELTKKAEKA